MWQRFLRATSWHSASLSPGEWGEFYSFLCVKRLSLSCTDRILSFCGLICAEGRAKPCILSPLPSPFICCFRSLYQGQTQGLLECLPPVFEQALSIVLAAWTPGGPLPALCQSLSSECCPPCVSNFVPPFEFTLPSVSGLPTDPQSTSNSPAVFMTIVLSIILHQRACSPPKALP